MSNAPRRLVLIAASALVSGGVAMAVALAFPGRTDTAPPMVEPIGVVETPFTTPTPPTPSPTPKPAPPATVRAGTRPAQRPQPTRRPTPRPAPKPTPCDEFQTDCPDTTDPPFPGE